MPLISSLGFMNALGFGFTGGAKLQCVLFTAPYNIKAVKYVTGSFGTQLSNSFSTGPNVKHVTTNRTGDYVSATEGSVSNNLRVCAWSKTSGFGTVFSSPTTMPTGNAYGSAFSADSSLLAVGTNSSPYLHLYSFTSAGFGTKFANPATLPTGITAAVSFGGNTAVFAPASATNGGGVWAVSGSGFGTKVFGGNYLSGTFNYDNTALLFGSLATPYLGIYRWNGSGTTGSSNPAALTGYVQHLAYAKDNTSVVARPGGTGNLIAFTVSAGVFGTKYADTNYTSGSGDICYDFQGVNMLFSESSSLKGIGFTAAGFGTAFNGPSISFSSESLCMIS
jgi:hypothetical protein